MRHLIHDTQDSHCTGTLTTDAEPEEDKEVAVLAERGRPTDAAAPSRASEPAGVADLGTPSTSADMVRPGPPGPAGAARYHALPHSTGVRLVDDALPGVHAHVLLDDEMAAPRRAAGAVRGRSKLRAA